jgi:WD repeat-containing protein 23
MDLDVILEALFSMQSNESPQQSIPRGTRLISLSGVDLRDLARYVTIRASSPPRETNRREEEEEEEEEEEGEEEYNSEDQEDFPWFPPVKEAQREGEELLHSGDFGRVGIKIRSRANNGNIVKSVLNQATHLIPNLNKEDLLTVCFNFSYQNHELNLLLSTRTSFQIPMELQLQPTTPTCTLPNFQMAY